MARHRSVLDGLLTDHPPSGAPGSRLGRVSVCSSVVGLSGSVVMDPSTIDFIRRTDGLILAFHQHPVEKRRRIVKDVVRRLVRNAGVHSLDLVIIDQSSRDEAEASLEHLFASVRDVVRTGLADPVLEGRVGEIVVHRVAEVAADLDGQSRSRLVEAIRWAGW